MEVVVTLCPHCNVPPPITHLVLSLSFFPPFLILTTMAPRSTRPNSRSNIPVTRKHGESDPNEPPKKRKTRQGKGGSDNERMAQDTVNIECKVENIVNIERSGRRAARRTTKATYVFLSLFSFFYYHFYFFLTNGYIFCYSKPLSPKTRRLRHSQVVVNPSLG